MNNTLGDGPIQPQYEQLMRDLANFLDGMFNGDLRGKDRTTGFCLMVFPFDGDGRANYISNANREDVVTMLKEQLARFEGQPEMKGRA